MKLSKITYEQAKEKWPTSHPCMIESDEYKQIVHHNMMVYNEAISDMEKLRAEKKAKRVKTKRVDLQDRFENTESYNIDQEIKKLTERINIVSGQLDLSGKCRAVTDSVNLKYLADYDSRILKLETQIAAIHAGQTEYQQDHDKRLKSLESLHYEVIHTKHS